MSKRSTFHNFDHLQAQSSLVFISSHFLSLSFQDARFVGGNHVLDVDERVEAAAALEDLQSLLDEVAKVLVKPLVVVYAVAGVYCGIERRGSEK